MRSNAKYRSQYEDMIRVSSTNNSHHLTSTLFLMFAIGTPLRERTYLHLTNRSPGYSAEARIVIRKNWTVPNIRKFLKVLLEIGHGSRVSIRGPIWQLPLDKQTGPFNSKFNKYLEENLYIDNQKVSKVITNISANHPIERIKQSLDLLTITKEETHEYDKFL